MEQVVGVAGAGVGRAGVNTGEYLESAGVDGGEEFFAAAQAQVLGQVGEDQPTSIAGFPDLDNPVWNALAVDYTGIVASGSR